MKKIYLFLLSFFFGFNFLTAGNAVGEWKILLSYFDTDKTADAKNIVFAVANGALYSFNKEDGSVETYSKLTGLSDNNITNITFNTKTNSLLIIYENGNIDVYTKKGIRNIPSLKDKMEITEKTVRNVYLKDNWAYLPTSVGIMEVDMTKYVVKDTYPKDTHTTSVCIDNNDIYISTPDNVLTSTSDKNLLDINNWEKYPLNTQSFNASEIIKLFLFDGKLCYLVKNKGLYYEDTDKVIVRFFSNTNLIDAYINDNKLVAYNTGTIYLFENTRSTPQKEISYEGIKSVSSVDNSNFWIGNGEKGLVKIDDKKDVSEKITIDGPKRNLFFYTTMQNNKLLAVGGGRSGDRFNLPGTFMILDTEKEKWNNYDEAAIMKEAGLNKSNDYMSVAVDPRDPDHYFVSSWGEGVYEFKGNEFVKLHNHTNSTLESIFTDPQTMGNYIRVDGLSYDKDNNLWMTNSQVTNAIKVYTSSGEWKQFYYSDLSGLYTIGRIFITSKNQKWINIFRPSDQIGVFVFDENTDKHRFFSSFYDQDTKLVDVTGYYSIAEDKNGAIWVGTSRGPIIFNNPVNTLEKGSNICYRIKVPSKEDPTKANYQLESNTVTAIAVDGGNRKWIGTQEAGVFLLNESGDEIIKEFNIDNSPLISNNILSISINDHTGDVFIGTSNGLMSYRDVATKGSEDYSDVYVFPNPVRENFNGTVTVTGLKENSFIKITDLNGNIICQGKSLGGQFGWDGNRANGERVKTGIYLVFAIDEDNKSENTVAKIMVIK